MNQVSISQLWGRAWDLFKANWLLLLGIFILAIIVSFIPFVGSLLVGVIMGPASVRAGFLVARQGKASFQETFGDLLAILKIFAYNLVLSLMPLIMIVLGSILKGEYSAREAGIILIVAGVITGLILSLFGWAGPYAILSRRADVFEAIGQSFSLTTQNFGTVFLALLSAVGIIILGLIPCGLGLLVVIPMCNVFLPLLYLELTRNSSTPSPS